MRRLIVLACVIALVVGALFAPPAGGSPPAVLVLLDPLFGLVVLPVAPADDTTPAYAYVPTGPAPSRAPPAFA
jgi:hypothetical protein